MNLQDTFNQWAKSRGQDYLNKQWLLSKWEMFESIEWQQEKYEIILKSIHRLLELKPSDLLLDIGCGGGWILKMLLPSVQQGVGVDFSTEMLKVASQTVDPARLLAAEVGQLPFKTESVEKILCYYVFINLTDEKYIEQSLTEIYRVLKKNGKALLGQIPQKDRGSAYDQAKQNYVKHFSQVQKNLGMDTADILCPPLKLYDKQWLTKLLDKHQIKFYFVDSFNPFYYAQQPTQVEWRFDLVLEK